MADKMKCPKCAGGVELKRVSFELINVDECPNCEGVWFDFFGNELDVILEQGRDHVPEELKASLTLEHGKIAPTDDASVSYLCPRCGIKLRRYWYCSEAGKSFLVDGCPAGDGVWLDDGELGKAFDFLELSKRTLAEYYTKKGILGKVQDLKKGRAGD
jgi:Zn-finger nucleic acid-binding protein